MSKIDVLGVQIDTLPMDELVEEICLNARKGNREIVSHANIKALNLAYEIEWFRQFLNGCDRVYCDGMGVRLAAHFLGHPTIPRYTLADWIWPLVERAARENLRFFFLGNPPGVARQAAQILVQQIPALRIATQHGYFDKMSGSPENEAVLENVNKSGADILLVGFGMPDQERWLSENWSLMRISVAITCGALFEYISGDLRRGPRWMTDNYLEWLARLLLSPRRYTGRYIRDIPLFTIRLLKQRFRIYPEAR